MRRRALPVTTLPLSPEQDRHRRVVRYAVMMGIRVVCIALCVVVPLQWMWIPALGAVLLPYFAVLVANAAGSTGRRVQRPDTPETGVMRLGEEPWESELRSRDARRDAGWDAPRETR